MRSGRMKEKIERALEMLHSCSLCPRECGADRLAGETGICGAPADLTVSSYNDHHGEEPPISGVRGSGTIFLTHCNLKCVFCQNYPISHLGNGERVSASRMAEMMLALQRRGCHNINFVTPTHYMPRILESVKIAAAEGLNIPLVYNCGGYESLEAVKLLEGVVDIYMPDIKYADEAPAREFSSAGDYFERARAAIKEMYRQVGPLRIDDNGIATRGLIVRHLVLPCGLAGSEKALKFIADELSTDVFISVMEQYFPAFSAKKTSDISRKITKEEYAEVVGIVERLGLHNGFIQGDPDIG
ncbi:MAG TPA: radical SAM protein [bacterium]|nr:radical SAM protein [bacterium]